MGVSFTGDMMKLKVSKEEIIEYEKLKIISQIASTKSKIELFESKYGCNFEEFERRVKTGKEKFEEWDDYIEWKAYVESLRDLESRLKEIENAKDITVA
jgi:hypothetical protein